MPIRPIDYQRIPYARNTGTLGQLLGLQAATSGQMWSDLGNTIAGGLRQYAQERQQAPIKAQEAEIRALQLQNARDEAEGRKQQSVRDQALAAYFSADPQPTVEGAIKIAGPSVGPKAFQDWFTARQAPLNVEIAATDRQAKADKDERDHRMAINKAGVEEMDKLADNARADAAAKKITYGGFERAVVNGKLAFVRPGSDGQVYGIGGQPVTGAVRPYVEPKGDSNEPLQAIVGPDGKAVLVRRSQAVGKTPATGTQKPASGVEKKALSFFNRARQADDDLEALESSIAELGLGGQAWMAIAPNFAQTEEGQLYTQAQRAFTEARLRKDSGAAIPKEEFENDRKTYFVQPGDDAATIAQKRRARGAILSSLGFESGQALGEFVGDADEASRIVQGYRDRSQRADAPKKNPFRKDH